jgi:hypothetical protein
VRCTQSVGDASVKNANVVSWIRVAAVLGAGLGILVWWGSHAALGATLTYTSPACTSFALSGPASSQTLSCAGGGGAPVCTPTNSPSSPAIGTSTTVSANCTNQPTTYSWTGTGCAGSTAATCSVSKGGAGSRTFTVQATNAAGTSAQAPITVTWH